MGSGRCRCSPEVFRPGCGSVLSSWAPSARLRQASVRERRRRRPPHHVSQGRACQGDPEGLQPYPPGERGGAGRTRGRPLAGGDGPGAGAALRAPQRVAGKGEQERRPGPRRDPAREAGKGVWEERRGR